MLDRQITDKEYLDHVEKELIPEMLAVDCYGIAQDLVKLLGIAREGIEEYPTKEQQQ